MKKQTIYFQLLKWILSVVIILLAVVLFIFSGTRSVLFPVEFGFAIALLILELLDGILYNKSHVIQIRKIVLYGIMAFLMLVFMILSIWTILK